MAVAVAVVVDVAVHPLAAQLPLVVTIACCRLAVVRKLLVVMVVCCRRAVVRMPSLFPVAVAVVGNRLPA